MKGLLIRVGIDSTFGNWNAPVDITSGRFAYIPIPETFGTAFHLGLERRYAEFGPCLKDLHQTSKSDHPKSFELPASLSNYSVHLDPDFSGLTYGDDGDTRGRELAKMSCGDFVVFYAGLRPTTRCEHKLLYAIIGFYHIDEIVPIASVAADHWHENAHTRKSKRCESDIIARATRGLSGRLDRCIPIGEWRNRAYRVRKDLLDIWGQLSVEDGYIQRSAVPPSFSDPIRFLNWFTSQKSTLLQRNN